MAEFLQGLTDLYKKTGVYIDHYEGVQIAFSKGVRHVTLVQMQNSDPVQYEIEERQT